MSRSGNQAKLIEFNGERKTVQEWSRLRGIPKGTIHARLYNGHSVEVALSKSALPKHSIKKQTMLTAHGVTRSVNEWSRVNGVPVSTIVSRMRSGHRTPEECVASRSFLNDVRNQEKSPAWRYFSWLPYECDETAQRLVEDNPQGMTLDEIGRAYGVSRELIRKVEAGALKKLRSIPGAMELLMEARYKEQLNKHNVFPESYGD